MNWRVVAPLFTIAGVAALTAFACAPQSTTDDDFGSGGSGTGGTVSGGSPYCGPASQCPVDVTGVDLTTPVSFANEVFPIFQRSCALTACHVSPVPSANNYLGPQTGTPTTDEFAMLIDGLKTPSATAPAMHNVVPGDWQNSFLMLKVDGCQDTRGLDCTVQDVRDCFENPCGIGMPNLDKPSEGKVFPLPEVERNKIRAWIAQGAQNN